MPPPEPSAAGAPRWRGVLSGLFSETAPLDLRLIGRTLLHAVLVGVVAGIVSVLFVAGLELLSVPWRATGPGADESS